jgi:hypothetical protein
MDEHVDGIYICSTPLAINRVLHEIEIPAQKQFGYRIII